MSGNMLRSTKRAQWQHQTLSSIQQFQLSLLKMSHLEVIGVLEAEAESNPYLKYRKPSRYGARSTTDVIEETQSVKRTFEEDLLSQLVFIYERESKEYDISEQLIYALDGHGYLPNVEEWERLHGKKTLAPILETLKSLTPMGCGSRNMGEYFLYCLSTLDYEAGDVLFERVKRYFELFSQFHDPDKVREEMKLKPKEMNEMVEVLSQFQPYPRMENEGSVGSYIVPEASIEEVDGALVVKMEDGLLMSVDLNEDEMQELSTKKEVNEKFLGDKKIRAKKLVDALEYRKQTIQNILEVMVRIHRDFFLGKSDDMKVYTMSEIAKKLGVNVSTVSRLVNDKFVETKRGILSMRDFFARTAVGGGTTKEVKDLISRVLSEFDSKEKPLSDRQIATACQRLGIKLAVRTVAKYRKEMGIVSSFDRKNSHE